MLALNPVTPPKTVPTSRTFDQQTSLFSGLPNTTQSLQACAARCAVFYEGDPVSTLYEVVQGVIKKYKLTPDGRRQIIGFAFPGEILGPVFGATYTCTAETVTVAKLRRLSRVRLLGALEDQRAAICHSAWTGSRR